MPPVPGELWDDSLVDSLSRDNPQDNPPPSFHRQSEEYGQDRTFTEAFRMAKVPNSRMVSLNSVAHGPPVAGQIVS